MHGAISIFDNFLNYHSKFDNISINGKFYAEILKKLAFLDINDM